MLNSFCKKNLLNKMEEKQRRRYCHGYHRPDGEELDAQREEDDDHYLEDPITLEPVPLEQDIVMFINERYNPVNIIIECYTVDTIRNTLRNLNIDRETGGVRNVLSATNRIINRNFIEKFNRGNRTFILREENRVFNPISINREQYFNLLNRIALGGENPLQDEGEIQREIDRIIAPPIQRPPPNQRFPQAQGNPAQRNPQGNPAHPIRDLFDAVAENNIEMARVFLQNGERDMLALPRAVRDNNMEMVRLLVENGVRDNFAVRNAVENGNMEMVEFLLANGMVDIPPVPLRNRRLPERRRIIIDNEDDDIPAQNNIPPQNNRRDLLMAVIENNIEEARVFLLNGERVGGILALDHAVENNNMAMVRLLVENGIRENFAVGMAARNNNMEMVRFLVENGMRDNMAIRRAIENGNMEMVEFLRANGMVGIPPVPPVPPRNRRFINEPGI